MWLPGQLSWTGEDAVRVRDTGMVSGDRLLPDEQGRVGCAKLPGLRIDPSTLPDPDALRSLSEMGAALDQLREGDWGSWVRHSPLMPPLDETLEPSALERALAAGLGYLEEVCKRPRTHLRSEALKMSVGRCKRPARRAARELASHSEDWERRTAWGVRPRRILSVVREEEYGIYENRVAVALVDHLVHALSARHRVIRRLVEMLRRKQDFQRLLEGGGSYRRVHRIASLWGEAFSDTAILARAEDALARVRGLRRRVLGLKNTLLYRRVGGSAGVGLRMTNVLTHDPNYRRVAELWLAWEAFRRETSTTPADRWRAEQRAAHGYMQFTQLCLVRGLQFLGYRPGEGSAPGMSEWCLNGPCGPVTLTVRDGVFLLTGARSNTLRVVSLPAVLDGSMGCRAWLDAVGMLTDTLVVTLPPDRYRGGAETVARLRSLGNLGEGGPMLVTAAPWDLESVEHVTRALRWWLWSDLYSRYPLPLGPVPERVRPKGVAVREGELVLDRPRDRESRSDMQLQDEVDRLDAELVAIGAQLRAMKRSDRGRLHLRQKEHELQVTRAALSDLVGSLSEADDIAVGWSTCPQCFTRADASAFEPLGPEFRCVCAGCGCQWGRRLCTECLGPVPFLWVAGPRTQSSSALGADVLSLPDPANGQVCPACGPATLT